MAPPKIDPERAKRFVWEDGDVIITPPPPGDNTAELYKDVDWDAILRAEEDDDEEGKSSLDDLRKRFEKYKK